MNNCRKLTQSMILPLSMVKHGINSTFDNTLRFDNTCFCTSTQDINNEGSGHKQWRRSIETIDTWCEYRYFPQLASIDSIDSWYRYRAHTYIKPLRGSKIPTHAFQPLYFGSALPDSLFKHLWVFSLILSSSQIWKLIIVMGPFDVSVGAHVPWHSGT